MHNLNTVFVGETSIILTKSTGPMGYFSISPSALYEIVVRVNGLALTLPLKGT